jgi:hypothetical protein
LASDWCEIGDLKEVDKILAGEADYEPEASLKRLKIGNTVANNCVL